MGYFSGIIIVEIILRRRAAPEVFVMRLFFAIPFPPQVRSALAGAQDQLRIQGVRGNFSRPENFHLTLAFLGETPRCRDAARVLAAVPDRCFSLTLGGLGRFGDVWWLGVDPCPPLEDTAASLQARLREAGFPLENRPFRPHITLLRQAQGPKAVRLDLPPLTMAVDRIVLMESLRQNGRLVYRAVQEKRLKI